MYSFKQPLSTTFAFGFCDRGNIWVTSGNSSVPSGNISVTSGMGVTQLISPFYRQLDPKTFRSRFESGQIVWIPTSFAADIPQVMEVQRESPDDHFASKFQIRNMKETDFRKKQKLPIKLLSLGETEELVVARSKLRPCVVLKIGQTSFADLTKALKQAGKGHLEKEDFAVIPLYSVEKEDGDAGFPAVMVARIKALMYPQFFFCPKHGVAVRNNSVGRLDRLFVARPVFPAFQPTDAALTPDAVMIPSPPAGPPPCS